jgi:hypothetical protein
MTGLCHEILFGRNTDRTQKHVDSEKRFSKICIRFGEN